MSFRRAYKRHRTLKQCRQLAFCLLMRYTMCEKHALVDRVREIVTAKFLMQFGVVCTTKLAMYRRHGSLMRGKKFSLKACEPT